MGIWQCSSMPTSAVGDHIGLVVGVEENLLPVGSINEVVWRCPHDLHDAQQLLNLILACKDTEQVRGPRQIL